MEKWDASAVICLDVLTRCDPISSQICGDSRLTPYPTCGPLSPGECFQARKPQIQHSVPKVVITYGGSLEWGYPKMDDLEWKIII